MKEISRTQVGESKFKSLLREVLHLVPDIIPQARLCLMEDTRGKPKKIPFNNSKCIHFRNFLQKINQIQKNNNNFFQKFIQK